MVAPTVDLWPEDIGVETDLVAPVTILKQQAALLGEKTHNLIKGEVKSEGTGGPNLAHGFYIVAPALQNYRYRLFIVKHDIELYPLQIETDNEQVISVQSPEEFLDALRNVFASERTKKIIHALIAQSEGLKVREPGPGVQWVPQPAPGGPF